MQIQLADGEIIMAPAPNLRHQRLVGNLFFLLETFIRKTGKGRLFLSPFDIYLSETTVLQPDISFFDPQTMRHLSKRGAEGAPTLVIEVLSPTTKDFDRNAKKELFAHFGVREMWLVDDKKHSIAVHDLESSEVKRFAKSGILTSRIFPGIETGLKEVFA